MYCPVNSLKCTFFGAAMVLAMNIPAQAQMIDMSKFTCGQLLAGGPNALETAIWTSGYYNGLHKNTKLDLGNMEQNAEVIVAACKDDPKKTLMQTINGMIAAGKKK